MPDSDNLLSQLDAAIAAQENLRGQLPDAVFDLIIQTLKSQRHAAQAVAVGRDNLGDINLGTIIHQFQPKPGAGRAELRMAYLARMLRQANQLPLFAGKSLSSQIRLAAIYTAIMIQESEGETDWKGQPSKISYIRQSVRSSVLERMNRTARLVLLGGPGSGKSTFIKYLTLCMAGDMLGADWANLRTLTAPLPSDQQNTYAKPQKWDLGVLIPVPIIVRDFVHDLSTSKGNTTAETLWRHIQNWLEKTSLGDFSVHLYEELLMQGGLILIDGLDELPEPERQRGQIKSILQDFAHTFSRCRFLVTCRSYAYTRHDWKLEGFNEAVLCPFSSSQIERFIAAWFAHMVEQAKLTSFDAEARAESLNRAITRSPQLAELSGNPLLLSLIAQIHTYRGGRLPEKREQLYDETVGLLLDQWESLKVSSMPDGSKTNTSSLSEWLSANPHNIRLELDKLAFEAHRDQADLKGTADIREERLIHALFNAATNKIVALGQLKAHLTDRAGLLVAHGPGLYQFPHRTFQEYLAACHLTVEGFPHNLAMLLRKDPNRWREVTLLAAAKVCRGTPEAVWSLVDALCFNDVKSFPVGREVSESLETDCWGALLAAQALWETGLAEDEPNPCHKPKRERLRRWLLAIVLHGWLPPPDRAIAGRMLSVLGDERDFDELVSIPAGEFCMGNNENNDAKPRHQVNLPAFQISLYPVTNAQYRRFTQATGLLWTSREADQPDRRNHPATQVSWHDALAYCQWLTEQHRQANMIGPDHYYTLPSEAEWERGAAGTEGRLYPWGNEWQDSYANTAELGLGEACTVGMFPQGQSEVGCLDMVGNVWEWTRSLWGKNWNLDFRYPYLVEDNKRENLTAGNNVSRIVRGGTWNNDSGYASCYFRYGLPPIDRNNFLGFRVVLVSSFITPS